jgi:cellulose synthase operon protein YhjQ
MPLICFASPKGGVGKTTLAANVASQLARGGERVVALDVDPQNALRLHFGVGLRDTAGFTHRLAARPDWRTALRHTPSGAALLSHGATDLVAATTLAAELGRTPALLAEPVRDILAQPGAWLVVDTAPGPSSQLSALLPLVDLLVTVLLVDAASISLIPSVESGECYGTAFTAGAGRERMGFVLNQFDPRTRLGPTIADGAARHLGTRLLGMVYRDESVAEATAAQKLVADYAPTSKAAQDIAAIARTIMARLAPAPPPPRPSTPVLSSWQRLTQS